MGNIVFTDLQQFIDELTIGHGRIERQIVRIAVFQCKGFWSSIIRRDHLVVTARIGRDIIRLDLYYSFFAALKEDEHDRLSSQGMESDMTKLERVCGKLKLRVGGGVLAEA